MGSAVATTDSTLNDTVQSKEPPTSRLENGLTGACMGIDRLLTGTIAAAQENYVNH